MKGNILYPLNKLKFIYPSIYQEAVKKYEGREYLLKAHIPTLNCLWNDVLHTVAVHPTKLEFALQNAGLSLSNRRFFEIDAREIDPGKMSVYLMQDKSVDRHSKLENYEKFEYKNLKEYSEVPEQTKRYYKKSALENKPIMLFGFIPHILFHGDIDVSKSQIIEL